jgi:hypothetical protein
MTRNLIASVAMLTVLVRPTGATAAEITVWTSRAIAKRLAEVGGDFERATGHRLIVTSDVPPGGMER